MLNSFLDSPSIYLLPFPLSFLPFPLVPVSSLLPPSFLLFSFFPLPLLSPSMNKRKQEENKKENTHTNIKEERERGRPGGGVRVSNLWFLFGFILRNIYFHVSRKWEKGQERNTQTSPTPSVPASGYFFR